MSEVLSVKDLKKNYGRFEALKGISFEVKDKEIFALIGPNGAGKTTTLRLIATILQPTSGIVKVAGLDIKEDAEKVREAISYLPEEAGVYKNLTGEYYLRFMAALFSGDKKEQAAYLETARAIANLGERLGNKIGTYSKGMTRKLLLARALMTKPKLAILDEPTSGLDVINALEIRNTIREFARTGTSVLLSSHNMLEIEYLSDRVAIIDKGTIHDIGTSDELKAKYDSANLEEVFAEVAR
ncbi:MAG: ABC transporter ATP-binding protein [Candidatus Aquicultor sp.]|nr:ABC transporter ATP-binding protein [Candidatus Aquicultor sp.]